MENYVAKILKTSLDADKLYDLLKSILLTFWLQIIVPKKFYRINLVKHGLLRKKNLVADPYSFLLVCIFSGVLGLAAFTVAILNLLRPPEEIVEFGQIERLHIPTIMILGFLLFAMIRLADAIQTRHTSRGERPDSTRKYFTKETMLFFVSMQFPVLLMVNIPTSFSIAVSMDTLYFYEKLGEWLFPTLHFTEFVNLLMIVLLVWLLFGYLGAAKAVPGAKIKFFCKFGLAVGLKYYSVGVLTGFLFLFIVFYPFFFIEPGMAAVLRSELCALFGC